jgi:hypothetical protein
VAPYHRSAHAAAADAFDRETGVAIPCEALKTYQEALAQYHLHSETKFLGGEFADRGPTRRRHIQVSAVQLIGKEAIRWEEQFFLGFDAGAVVEYESSPNDVRDMFNAIRDAAKRFGLRKLASAGGISRQHMSALLAREDASLPEMLAKLQKAVASLEVAEPAQ